MRRIWIFCLMTFLVIGVSLAQNTVLTHDVKGKVVDNYGQPVVGALVYVEGTELSTVTDVEGKFLLRGVPVSVEELTVEAIGLSKKQVKVDQPIQVGRRKRAKDVTSFVLLQVLELTGLQRKAEVVCLPMNWVWELNSVCPENGLSVLCFNLATVELNTATMKRDIHTLRPGS